MFQQNLDVSTQNYILQNMGHIVLSLKWYVFHVSVL